MRWHHIILAAVIALLLIPGLRAATVDGSPCLSNSALTCVMSGLDNVRGLAFGPEGALYAVEGGKGGDGPCTIESGARVCYGPTGAITRLWQGVQERVVEGLPSLAVNDPATPNRKGQVANGPTDLAFGPAEDEDGDGIADTWTAYLTIGLRNDPNKRNDLGQAGAGFAQLLRFAPNGKARFIGDIGTYEIEANPDGGPIDSNPFGLLVDHGSRIVVDSGANALLRVTGNGHGPISTIATFPSRAQGEPTDAVPTSVAVGPDGAYYVSELKGVPFATWNSPVVRVVPGETPTVFIDGFKMIVDIAFDAGGNLFVLQYATATGSTFGRSGALVKVAPDGTRTTIIGGLRQPTSVVIGDDGAVYVANNGSFPAIGEVIRIGP